MGESQGVGAGAAGFAGAAAGLAVGAAGAAAAGFEGVAGAAGAGFVSDETGPPAGEPEGAAFTAPALAGCSAAGFGSPSGGDAGDLISSGIFAQTQTYGSVCIEKNDNFYQLEEAKSTRRRATTVSKSRMHRNLTPSVILSKLSRAQRTTAPSKDPFHPRGTSGPARSPGRAASGSAPASNREV